MSKHEELRRKLQMIRDALLELNKTWFELEDIGAISDTLTTEKQYTAPLCPGDISHMVHDMTARVKHDESTIEKLLKNGGK